MNERAIEIRAEQPLMRVALILGLLFALLTAGCAGVKPPPPVAPSPTASPQTGAETMAPVVPPASPPSPSAETATPSATAAVEPASAPSTPSTSASPDQRETKTAPSAAKTPPSAPAPPAAKGPPTAPAAKAPPPAPAAQAAKKDSTPPDVAKPKAPPLDLTSLEARLKETDAIGVLTKIALKNQVDDLLNQFRAFYQGKLKTTLAELRRPYELLVLKVLALLQDTDPALASAIVASREAIWGILSDPAKFATI
jgi:hypothetical protein